MSEALANAGKHGGAQAVTVYAEPDDDGGVFCSVKDDGARVRSRGRRRRRAHAVDPGRVADVGGRVEVDGNPGRGTEVRLWV